VDTLGVCAHISQLRASQVNVRFDFASVHVNHTKGRCCRICRITANDVRFQRHTRLRGHDRNSKAIHSVAGEGKGASRLCNHHIPTAQHDP
jgi:hypothetical protein